MSFGRIIFAVVLIAPILGFAGSKYLTSALLAPEPQPVAPPLPSSKPKLTTISPVTVTTPTRVTHLAQLMVTTTPRALKRVTPTKTPIRTATPHPFPSPTSGVITLSRYWVSDTNVHRGETISVGYLISNGTGRPSRVMLGASLKSSHVASWLRGAISDPGKDVVTTIPPGTTTHTRYFTVSSRLSSGFYDVAWGLRNAATGQVDAVVSTTSVLHVST